MHLDIEIAVSQNKNYSSICQYTKVIKMFAPPVKWLRKAVQSKWFGMSLLTAIPLGSWLYFGSVVTHRSNKINIEGDSPIGHSLDSRALPTAGIARHEKLNTSIQRWEVADKLEKDEIDRFEDHRGIASFMAANGYSRKAIDRIILSYGPGKARCQLISDVFRFSQNPDDLPELFTQLEFVDEKIAASEGIGRALAFAGGPVEMDFKQYGFLSTHLDVMLATFAETYVVQNSSGSKQELTQAFGVAFDLPLSKESLRVTLLKLAAIAPFDCWDYISKKGLDLHSREAAEIVRQMVHASGRSTAERILSSPQSAEFLNQSILLWMKVDASEPIKWIQAESASMTDVQRDKAYEGVVSYAISQGELDAARKWTESIVDRDQRKKVEGRIWAFERDSLRKEVGKDPAGTVQSIIFGQSKYGDYWLEEAVGTWVAKDFDKAQDWYQQNWNSLPTGKSQYVAAAFATQAIKQGDTATARQWAAHIQDAKTKQRIEDGIAKAEGPAGN